jgi:uncharacterized protein YxeA
MKKWLITVTVLLLIICIEIIYLVHVQQTKEARVYQQQMELNRMMDQIEFQTDQLQIRLISIREHLETEGQDNAFRPVFTYRSSDHPKYNRLDVSSNFTDN